MRKGVGSCKQAGVEGADAEDTNKGIPVPTLISFFAGGEDARIHSLHASTVQDCITFFQRNPGFLENLPSNQTGHGLQSFCTTPGSSTAVMFGRVHITGPQTPACSGPHSSCN